MVLVSHSSLFIYLSVETKSCRVTLLVASPLLSAHDVRVRYGVLEAPRITYFCAMTVTFPLLISQTYDVILLRD